MNAPTILNKTKAPGLRLWLVVAIVAVVIVVFISVLTLQLIPPQSTNPLIVSVSASPNPAPPNSILAIEVISEYGTGSGSPPVNLAFQTTFAENATAEARGGGLMDWPDGNRHTMRIGPFMDGTAVWIVVVAYGSGWDFVIDSSLVVSVGNVIRGGPSGLNITDLAQTPINPTVQDTVIVNATVTSASAMGDVEVLRAYVDSTEVGITSWLMTRTSSTQFTAEFDDPFLFGYVYKPGTIFLYRIAAMDESNNTAMTEVRLFAWT